MLHVDRLGLFAARTLLGIAVVLGSVGTAAATELPVPPCAAASPIPDYAKPGAPPNLRVWNSQELSVPWVPPVCTGWNAKSGGVLVALAGSFPYRGGVDGLLARFGAISALAGIQYWSVTEGGWRTLITHATALDGPDVTHPRADFTLAAMRGGHDLYFAQTDNRSSGDVVYRMRVREIGPGGFTVVIENVSPVSRFLITLFDPGDLQAVHYLARQGPDVWGYYGLAWAGESMPSLLGIGEASYANRAQALYRHFVGDPKDRAPPR
jgi:hypothetical protein